MLVAPELLGTIPQWLSTIGLGGVFVALLRRDVLIRGQRNTNEADIRDHYAQEVQALRSQIMTLEKHYREMLSLSDKRHEECENGRTELKDKVDGLERQIKLSSADRVLNIGEPEAERAPHARASAERVKHIVENGDRRK